MTPRRDLLDHGRIWWFFRMAWFLRKHRVLGFHGLRKTWQDARVAAKSMRSKQELQGSGASPKGNAPRSNFSKN